MRVRLLEDHLVNGQPKVYVKKNRGYRHVMTKGAVLDASDTTAEKWIADGVAEAAPDAELTREPLPEEPAAE